MGSLSIFLDNTLYHGVRPWEGMLEYEAFGIKLLGLLDVGKEPSILVGPIILCIHHSTYIRLLNIQLLCFSLLLE